VKIKKRWDYVSTCVAIILILPSTVINNTDPVTPNRYWIVFFECGVFGLMERSCYEIVFYGDDD